MSKIANSNLRSNILIVLGYVSDVMEGLFTCSQKVLLEVADKYQKKAPVPLCQQFPDRLNREAAVKHYHEKRKLAEPTLFPSCKLTIMYKTDANFDSA